MTSKLITEYQVTRMINGKGFDDAAINIGSRGAFAGSGAMDNFQNALKESYWRRVTINVLGDSISEGNFARDMRSLPSGTSYIAVLKNQLQLRYGDGGSGYQQFYNPSLNGAAYTGLNTAPVTITGVVNTDISFPTSIATPLIGVPPGSYTEIITGTGTITSYARGSSIVVFAIGRDLGGVATVTIDGIVQSPFSTVTTDPTYVTQVYTGFDPNVTHTITIGKSSTTGTFVDLMGVGGYNPTGIVFNKFTIPGLSTKTVTDTSVASSATFSTNLPYLWNTISGTLMAENVSGIYPAANTRNSSQIPFLRCDLFMYVLNINNPAIASYDLYNLMFVGFNAMKQSNPLLNFICVQPVAGTFNNGTVTAGDSSYNGFSYAQYRRLTKELMDLFGGLFLDLNLLIPGMQSISTSSSQGFWGVGTTNYAAACASGQAGLSGSITNANINAVHPSDIGHQMMAFALLPFFLMDI
jgi:hypothetical protein